MSGLYHRCWARTIEGMRAPVVLAAAVFAFGWGRLLYNHSTTASPANQIQFFGIDGTPTERPYCHGGAWLFDETLWWFCNQQIDGTSTDYLTRFDFAAGSAQFVRKFGHEWRSISAAVSHPQGGAVVVVGNERVVRWLPSGEWQDLGSKVFKWAPSLAVRDGAIEVVYGTDQENAVVARLDGKGWSQKTMTLPKVEGTQQRFAGGLLTAEGWRMSWIRTPETHSGPSVPVTIHSGLLGREIQRETTLQIGPESRDWVALKDGQVIIVNAQLLARAGAIPRWSEPPSFERSKAGVWAKAAVPPDFGGRLVRRDFVLSGPRAGVTLVSDAGDRHARVHGRWFSLTGERTWNVNLLADDLTTVEQTGSPTADRFWLSTGLALLPDNADGYWLVGSLGEAYIHLDAKLQRTDALGLFARIGRALTEDKAKRNSDFYPSLGFLKRSSFLWVLFAFPLLLGGFAPRRRWDWAAGAYLVGAALGGYWFWRLSGVFF